MAARAKRSWAASCVMGLCILMGGTAYGQPETPPQEALPVLKSLDNLSRGFRFAPPLTAIAQSPSNPDVIYVGTEHGLVYTTDDGGLSWEEGGALVKRGRFYGAIRKQGGGSGASLPGAGPKSTSYSRVSGVNAPSNQFGGRDPGGPNAGSIEDSDQFSNSAFTADSAALTNGELTKAASDGSAVRSHYNAMFVPASGGSAAATSGGSDLAVGIRARAPRLAIQVRRKKRWGIGTSLQQSLALKSGGGTAIHFFDINPQNPNDALVATADGLRRTTDGGYSWPLVLTGATKDERHVNHIARHPKNREVIFVGTSLGLKISRDGGKTWQPALHPLASSSDVRWIEFDIQNPDVIYIGVTFGLLRTTDGGRSFGLIFRSAWPPLSRVRAVRRDPHDPQRVWLATADGLLLSEDGGGKFERVGGLVFVGFSVWTLTFGREPGHLYATTTRDIWETRDGGKTWTITYFGPNHWKNMFTIKDQSRENSLLILTQAEVLRYGPARHGPVSMDAVHRFRRHTAGEPLLNEVVAAALKRSGLYIPQLLGYRRGARWAGLLPTVEAAVGYLDFDGDYLRNNVQSNIDGLSVSRRGGLETTVFSVFANWNLDHLIFTRNEAPITRAARVNLHMEWVVKSTVVTLYEERRRLLLESFVRPENGRIGLLRALRLEELTAHLNALSGDLFQPMPAL